MYAGRFCMYVFILHKVILEPELPAAPRPPLAVLQVPGWSTTLPSPASTWVPFPSPHSRITPGATAEESSSCYIIWTTWISVGYFLCVPTVPLTSFEHRSVILKCKFFFPYPPPPLGYRPLWLGRGYNQCYMPSTQNRAYHRVSALETFVG